MRSDDDERYLQALGEAASGLLIYDARPYLNAHANRATGGGVENKGNYDNISVTFGTHCKALMRRWTRST
jgi:hypothetical protein